MDATTQPRTRRGLATRTRILAAAQAAFAARGFAQTGVRDIAGDAAVTPSLVIKYFGSKSALFEAALSTALVGDATPDWDKADYAAVLVRSVGDPSIAMPAPAMIALSLGDDEARAIAARVVCRHVVPRLARWVARPDAEARAINLMMLGFGYAVIDRCLAAELPPETRHAAERLFIRLSDIILTEDAGGRLAGDARG